MNILDEQGKLLSRFLARMVSRSTPTKGHLTTVDIFLYSHETGTLADKINIQCHLEKCAFCRDIFDGCHAFSHFNISTLAHYVLGRNNWNPLGPEEQAEIKDHIGEPDSGRLVDFNCYHCHRIIGYMEQLSRSTLFRLKNNDPLTLKKYADLFETPDNSSLALKVLAGMM